MPVRGKDGAGEVAEPAAVRPWVRLLAGRQREREAVRLRALLLVERRWATEDEMGQERRRRWLPGELRAGAGERAAVCEERVARLLAAVEFVVCG